MRQPIPLRADYHALRLRRIARGSDDAGQVRRLLALAMIYEGGSRTEAAEVGGVTLQVVRDWVLRFNEQGPEGLIDRKAPGQPSRLNDADLSPKFPLVKNRVLGCRRAHRDGVSLFGRAAFLRPGRPLDRRRAQPGSSLAEG